jgi:capsular polysaccharide transport system permease protein
MDNREDILWGLKASPAHILLFIISRPLYIALLVTLSGIFYWTALASDRYVSEAWLVVENTDLTPSGANDLGNLLGGATTGNRDIMLLMEHLKSVDMLQKVDALHNIRGHYSDASHDWFSRLRQVNAPIETLHDYFLNRVSVVFDDYSGVLRVKASAYTAEKARQIATAMLSEGEHFMNRTGHQLAAEQMQFIELEVSRMQQKAMASRQAMLNYQNKHSLVSPTGKVESLSAVAASHEAELSRLHARRREVSQYLASNAPELSMLNNQIQALSEQLTAVQSRLASTEGEALNRVAEMFQRMQTQADFDNQRYQSSLTAMEQARIEATRKLKKVTVLQSPSLPGSPSEPRRLYNSLMLGLVCLILAGIASLGLMIIQDHRS